MNLKKLQEFLGSGRDLVKLPDYFSIIVDERKFEFRRTPKNAQKLLKYPRDKLMEEIKWPQNVGTYDIGDVANPVMLICPSQDRELQEHAIYAGVCATGPCLTPRGVELLITNTISNPNIRFLILAGRDSGHLTGDLIENLILNGVDENRKVIGTKCPSFPYLPNLSLEAINKFREQLEVINLIGVFDPTLITLIIRLCLQEPSNAYELTYEEKVSPLFKQIKNPKKITHTLFDKGTENKEPMVLSYSLVDLQSLPYEAFSTTGTTVYASTVEEAHRILVDFLKRAGVWVKQESNRMGLDVIATTIVVENLEQGLYPKNYKPVEWVDSDEKMKQYLKAYGVWNYLVPWSNVVFDESLDKTVPSIPDMKYLSYSYGTRITAKGMDSCKKEEKEGIIKLVKSFQEKYYEKVPDFKSILNFYHNLKEIQKQSFNQLLAVTKAGSIIIKDNITGTYRPYLQLHVADDLRPIDPRKMHNPCYCMFVPFFRKTYYREYNKDGVTRRFLVPSLNVEKEKDLKYDWLFIPSAYLRAHDWFAFPANVHGSLAMGNFILQYLEKETGKKIPWGCYSHHASSLHLVDYSLDKDLIEKLNRTLPSDKN